MVVASFFKMLVTKITIKHCTITLKTIFRHYILVIIHYIL